MGSSWFHTHNGWFFRRGENGAVEVGQGPDFDNVEVVATFDDGTWASVVAYVSTRGEHHETFNQALQFHNQD